MNLLLQLLRRLASQDIQHNRVGDQFRLVGVLLQSRSQGGLGLRQPTEMEFSHGLTDDRKGRGGARSGSQFLVDVERSLVFLAALKAEAQSKLAFIAQPQTTKDRVNSSMRCIWVNHIQLSFQPTTQPS